MGEQEKPVPTQDEQMHACLAQFLQMVGWGFGFIGPLVIFLLKRDSRFVAFHAMQALLWQILYAVLTMASFVFFFVAMFASFPPPGGPKSSPSGPPTAILLFFPLIWLVMIGGWVLTLVFAIVYGIKAMHGQWAAYPLLGRLAKRIVGV